MIRRCVLALFALAACGCASTVALDRAVLAYDATTTDSISKQLLLNIARARYNQPIHFTAISNIAATYRVTINAGVGPALTGDSGGLLVPVLGVAREESPTVSISPMQGEEFTQRLLTPFRDDRLTMLLRQGYDVDALVRLLGAEVRIASDSSGTVTVHANRPSDVTGYPIFRRVVAHLSAIQDRHSLYVEPLHFTHTWTVPVDAVTPDAFETTYKGFSLLLDAEQQAYQVSRRINGRVMISNYDPDDLSNEDRLRLHEEAEQVPVHDVLIDVRPGYPGGEFPLHGRLRLRSFHEVLTFIARGMDEEPEYDVAPDPRTPAIMENPARTLEILETQRLPAGVTLAVGFRGRQYAVQPQPGYQWNQKVFSLLYQLFQMSMTTVAPGGPTLAIVK